MRPKLRSFSSKYFLMYREKRGKKEGCIAKLQKGQDGNYKFTAKSYLVTFDDDLNTRFLSIND